MEKLEIIKSITERTGGDIYLGVVGAVRTGKSTFIIFSIIFGSAAKSWCEFRIIIPARVTIVTGISNVHANP